MILKRITLGNYVINFRQFYWLIIPSFLYSLLFFLNLYLDGLLNYSSSLPYRLHLLGIISIFFWEPLVKKKWEALGIYFIIIISNIFIFILLRSHFIEWSSSYFPLFTIPLLFIVKAKFIDGSRYYFLYAAVGIFYTSALFIQNLLQLIIPRWVFEHLTIDWLFLIPHEFIFCWFSLFIIYYIICIINKIPQNDNFNLKISRRLFFLNLFALLSALSLSICFLYLLLTLLLFQSTYELGFGIFHMLVTCLVTFTVFLLISYLSFKLVSLYLKSEKKSLSS